MDNNYQDIHIIDTRTNNPDIIIRCVRILGVTFKYSLIEVEYLEGEKDKTLIVKKKFNRLIID